MSTNKVTISPTATLIIAGNYERVSLELENQGTVVISISDDSSMDSTVGVTLQVGEKRSDFPPGDDAKFFYQGPVYGAVASGTAVCRYVEWVTYRE